MSDYRGHHVTRSSRARILARSRLNPFEVTDSSPSIESTSPPAIAESSSSSSSFSTESTPVGTIRDFDFHTLPIELKAKVMEELSNVTLVSLYDAYENKEHSDIVRAWINNILRRRYERKPAFTISNRKGGFGYFVKMCRYFKDIMSNFTSMVYYTEYTVFEKDVNVHEVCKYWSETERFPNLRTIVILCGSYTEHPPYARSVVACVLTNTRIENVYYGCHLVLTSDLRLWQDFLQRISNNQRRLNIYYDAEFTDIFYKKIFRTYIGHPSISFIPITDENYYPHYPHYRRDQLNQLLG